LHGAGKAAFHIAGAATVGSPIGDRHLPGRRMPICQVASWHHIDVPVQDEAAAAGFYSPDPAYKTGGLRALILGAIGRVLLETRQIDVPQVNLHALPAHPVGEIFLDGRLLPAQALEGDQVVEGG
jgi:hypothetical protein